MKRAIIVLILLVPLISANICEEGYFDIINNNWKVNKTLFEEKHNVSFDLFVDVYPENCELLGYPTLPNKLDYPTMIIYKNKTNCSLEVNGLFGFSMPTPKFISINFNSECPKITKYFLSLEEFDKYYVRGIRIFPIIVLFVLLVIILFIKKERKINKLID